MKRFYFPFYSLLLLLLFFTLFFRPITAINEDLGRHILFGKIIVQTHTVPQTNLLSFTYPNYPFVATSWLSEVIFFEITKIAGLNSLLLVSVGIVFTACLLQIKFVSARYSSIAIFTVSTLYIIFLGIRSNIRPEIFSMLFMSLFIFILHSYKKLPFIAISTLVTLEILWVNMHIYFFVGPLLVALFSLDRFIVQKKLSIKEVLIVAGVSGVTLLNPNGLKGSLFPFVVLQDYELPVVENQSIFTLLQLFRVEGILLPIFAAIILFSLLIIGRKNTKPIDWFLALVFSILLILNVRNILLFVFATFIPMVSQLSFVVKKYSKRVTSIPHPPFFVSYLLVIFIVLMVMIKAVSVHSVGFGIKEHGQGSVDFIIDNKIIGRLYNDFDIGGYLAYRIYPQLVFLDNRPEAYPTDFFEKTYLPMQNNHQIFTQLNSKYNFNALIVSHRDGSAWKHNLLSYLIQSPDYVLVYLDSYAFVMLRNVPANQKIIDTFKISEKSLHFSYEADPHELIYYLSFFEKIGWNNKAKEVFAQLKKVDPTLCTLENFPLLRQARIDFISKSDFKKCKLF